MKQINTRNCAGYARANNLTKSIIIIDIVGPKR